MDVEVTVTYLEMTDAAQLRPAPAVAAEELSIAEAQVPSAELSRFLYEEVGRQWHWVDRRGWTLEQWQAWLEGAGVRTWLATHHEEPAGYFQLACDETGDTEIAYFGFLPRFVGRGWGGWLLTVAVQQAFWIGANRVWLHTCTLDHPAALPNYQKRGFRLFDRRQERRAVD